LAGAGVNQGAGRQLFIADLDNRLKDGGKVVSLTRPRSPTECVRSRKTEVNGEVHGGRPRPTGAVVPRGKKYIYIHTHTHTPYCFIS
jgi:hypothetical protein